LAAAELGRRKRNEEEAQEVAWQRALLDSSSEAVILLDVAGRIAASSRGARELTSFASGEEEKSPASLREGEQFAGLFRVGARERIEEWMRGTLEGRPELRAAGEVSPQAELYNGICVRVRIAGPAPGRGLAILLEPLAAYESAGPADRAETELQSVLEWMEEGVALFDAQENVRAMNTRFEQIAGLGPGDSRKIKTLEALIERLAEHAPSPERFAEHWRKLARGLESGVREELQMARLAPRIVERASRPVLDAVGRQLGRSGTIHVRTKRIGEQKMLLEVRDDGPGVPPAILARIFDPFFTTKPAGVGTGLGLAIVLSVVREHGGQVHFLNPPQGGAVFQIELPAAALHFREETGEFSQQEGRSMPRASPRRAERKERPASRQASRKGSRILVVEDEPTVARLIADVLEDEGFDVDVLLDGREALDRAARESYNLVICDMKMPGLDGQNFYKSLERAGNPLHERFLFVTGDIVAAQTQEFLRRNDLPHVAKPFRVEELTEKVHRVLESKVRRESAVTSTRKDAARNG